MPNDIERTNESTKKLPKRRLTPKQRKFVKLYIESGFNGTRAAKAMGCSDVSAPAIGSRMSRNVTVQMAVDDYLRDQGVSKPRLLQELTRLAYDQDCAAKHVPLKAKALDIIGKVTEVEGSTQKTIYQPPLVEMLINSADNLAVCSVVGLPPDMSAGRDDANSSRSAGLSPETAGAGDDSDRE